KRLTDGDWEMKEAGDAGLPVFGACSQFPRYSMRNGSAHLFFFVDLLLVGLGLHIRAVVHAVAPPLEAFLVAQEARGGFTQFVANTRVLVEERLQGFMVLQIVPVVDEFRFFAQVLLNAFMLVKKVIHVSE